MDMQENALFEYIREEVKIVKSNVLSNLEEYYIYSYTPSYDYERGAYQHDTYDHDNHHKNAINDWLDSAVHLILSHCYNDDVYDILSAIIDPDITNVSINQNGFQNNNSVSINCQIFNNSTNVKNLIFILSSMLKEVFIKLGLEKVLSQVIPHYSEHNSIINKILGYRNVGRDWIFLTPLEHCIYLIKYSMKHHQDY